MARSNPSRCRSTRPRSGIWRTGRTAMSSAEWIRLFSADGEFHVVGFAALDGEGQAGFLRVGVPRGESDLRRRVHFAARDGCDRDLMRTRFGAVAFDERAHGEAPVRTDVAASGDRTS